MKVVLAVDALSPPLTGIGRYAFELATRLREMDVIRELRLYDAGYWVRDEPALLERALQHAPADLARPIRRKRKLPRWVRTHLAPTYWRFALRGRVFHGPNYFLPPQADKGVVTVHDLSIFRYPEMHPAARLKQFELHFERSMRRTHHIITDSQAIRGDVMKHLGWPADRISAIPLGVSSQFHPRDAAQTDEILRRHGLTHGGYTLCACTIEPRKNLDKLLHAYALLPAAWKARTPLVMLGAPGWENAAVRTDILRGQAEGWLIHLGFVQESDLPAIYAGASLFAFPSIYEGFGLPVLEAMASGTPVITSNRSSLPEVAGNAALLIDPDDIEALRDALLRGLEDEPWRTSARALGLERAQAHSWERCIESTADVYRRVDALH